MKRTYILSFILSFSFTLTLNSQKIPTTEEQLKEMNQVVMPAYEDTISATKGKEFRVLILGNSLTTHGKAENIGWNFNHGMAASSRKNDFAHLLFEKLENLHPERKIHLRTTSLFSFEKNFNTYDFRSIKELTAFNADLIIFQLGDNVNFSSEKTSHLFEKQYTILIEQFKNKNNPIIICTTPFFSNIKRNESIEKVALSSHVFLVDLSHLSLINKENCAENEKDYPNDRSIWKAYAIGLHPGDLGMRNIAQQLFITINAATTANKNTELKHSRRRKKEDPNSL